MLELSMRVIDCGEQPPSCGIVGSNLFTLVCSEEQVTLFTENKTKEKGINRISIFHFACE
jgi:hypothetical protein